MKNIVYITFIIFISVYLFDYFIATKNDDDKSEHNKN